MTLPDGLCAAVHAHDATIAPLSRIGIDLRRTGRALLADLQARRDEFQQRHRELEAAQREANTLLPELLTLYTSGSDDEREELRALLAECTSFRWALGWGLFDRIVTPDDMRQALAVLSMKDGGSDWRDEIVALDHLCGVMRKAGMPMAPLLREAAGWSSDVSRFGNARSTRALLLSYDERFAQE